MSAEAPLFSILMANYNNGRYLQEAIDSVLAQTYSNWEIVLVDDKSTDGSQAIYDKYVSDSRFKIYFNDGNRGCGYTKRRCADLASGELCAYLDPDDALMPTALETMVREHPECSLIYSTAYRYSGDRNGDLIVWDYVGAIPAGKDFIVYRKKLVFHFAAFKKQAYDRTGGTDPFFKADVDRDLYLRLEEVGELRHIPVPLYLYRTNNVNSISIGSKAADTRAYHYSVVCQLDAICRRMGGELYCRNEEDYLQYMRVLMDVFHHSFLFDRKRFIKYCWYYLKGRHFSPHAFSHIYKILKKKK